MGCSYLLIDHPDATLGWRSWNLIKGPDFPTGEHVVLGRAGIRAADPTGRGKTLRLLRRVTEIEERKNGAFRIVVTRNSLYGQ